MALSLVQPSAKREGFATVPDTTWEDVGALEGVREELSMAILVGGACGWGYRDRPLIMWYQIHNF